MFKINDKVVFIGWPEGFEDEDDGINDDCSTDLVEGRVYCIRGIKASQNEDQDDWGILLLGEHAGHYEGGDEASWWHRMFRLVSEVQAENRAKRKEKSPK